MSTPLPSGARAAASAVPAAGRGLARRCSWVARCRCAWPCRPAPGRLRRRLSPARRRRCSASSGPEYLGRAGERAVPPAMSLPAPVTASRRLAVPGLGRARGLAVGRDAGPRATGVVDQPSVARFTPPAPIPSAPPVIVRSRPPHADADADADADAGRPPPSRRTRLLRPPSPRRLPRQRRPRRLLPHPWLTSSPAGARRSVPPHPARRCCADHRVPTAGARPGRPGRPGAASDPPSTRDASRPTFSEDAWT